MKGIKLTPAVFVAVVDESEGSKTILLQRRANKKFMNGYYEIAAGHIENSETPIQTAKRELFEETGLSAKEKDIKLFHVMVNQSDTSDNPYLYMFFKIKISDCKGKYSIQEKDKCDDMGMFALNKLPEKTARYVKTALACVDSDSVSYSIY